MKLTWLFIAGLLLAVVVGMLVILGYEPEETPAAPVTSAPAIATIRIGLIPERDIYSMRKRHKILADYISGQIGRPVELVTGNSYETVLKDFTDHSIDAALLGSLVTVLCVDRLDTRVLVKTELPDGTSTYHGVICVPAESPITSVEQLAGKSIAMVRTTTAGNLFPIHDMLRRGLLQGGNPPRIIWVGTHDEAIDVMMNASADAAAAKDLRVSAWLEAHPGRKVRVLAKSGAVPENTMVVRHDLAESLGPELLRILLDMDKTEAGRTALREYGASRFSPCRIEDYKVIYDLIADLGDQWKTLGVAGPAPKPLPLSQER